jgi:hypothetical protein
MFVKDRCDFASLVAVLVESFFEEILRKDTRLLETIHALLYFDIDCTAVNSQVFEVVEFDKIGWYVTDFHAHVFWLVHGCVEVEILQINGAVAWVLYWDDTAEMKLDSDHVDFRCAAVAGVVKEITTHSDSCAIGVLLLWVIIYTDSSVRDIMFAVVCDVLVSDENDSVGTFPESGGALSETSKFLRVGIGPQFLVLGVYQ